MISQYYDRPDAEQPRARQVGEALPTRGQQPQPIESASRGAAAIDELVERARWLMRRDPMRERGRGVKRET